MRLSEAINQVDNISRNDACVNHAAEILDSALHIAEQGEAAIGAYEASILLASSYAYRITGKQSFRESAKRSFSRLKSLLETRPLPPALFGGISGSAFSIIEASNCSDVLEEEIDFSEVDSFLIATIEAESQNNVELLTGLGGIGVYAIRRALEHKQDDLLATVLRVLKERAVTSRSGPKWQNPPHARPPSMRNKSIEDLDLGLAHGSAGPVALMVAAAYMCRPEYREFADRAVDALLSDLRTRSDSTIYLPHTRQCNRYSRTAWCYGEVGALAAVASWLPSDCKKRAMLVKIVISSCSELSGEVSGVVDSGLCHGSSGIATCLASLRNPQCSSQKNLNEDIESQLRRWEEMTLQYVLSSEKVGTVLSYQPLHGAFFSDVSFLTGAIGVSLALMDIDRGAVGTWAMQLMLRPSEELT